MLVEEKQIGLAAVYGMSAPLRTSLALPQLQGRSVRDLIEIAISTPQDSGTAARAARAMSEVLSSNRPVDIEVYRNDVDFDRPGTPASLNDVVLGNHEEMNGSEVDELGVKVTEHFKAG